MAVPESWIKLNRNITKWGWYTDANTVRVFIHLLLKANIEDKVFLGIPVKRGELITSYSKLSQQLKMSTQSIRTALNHLKSTGELTIRTTPNWTLIAIENYEKYQDAPQEDNKKPKMKKQANKVTNKRLTNDQQTTNKRLTTTKEYKNIRNKEYIGLRPDLPTAEGDGKQVADDYVPEDWEVEEVPKMLWGRFDSLKDWREWRDK